MDTKIVQGRSNSKSSLLEFAIAEKLCQREHEQIHLFIAEKLSKRELEQTHLFIAECSQLWIKSVQPALDIVNTQPILGKAKDSASRIFVQTESNSKLVWTMQSAVENGRSQR